MPHLTFDFLDLDSGATRRRIFRQPREVLTARTPGEVTKVLAAVEEAAADGFHAAGFLSYEAAPAFDPALRVRPATRLPLAWFGIFTAPETGPPPDPPGAAASGAEPGPPADEWHLDPGPEAHAAAVARIREAIAEGRTYQVNYTARLRTRLAAADPVALYDRMRHAQGSGYHALLDLGEDVIVSASPELFFRRQGRTVTTRPMKGTRPRGRWPEEDEEVARVLQTSPKDRAENLMIVDLLRNDLGRVCRTGSIETPRLLELERYRTVWQLTSTITGILRDDVRLLDLFAALFPCGSVTGAPKISTMELITGLETAPRGAYCGAIGFVEPMGDCVFNVPIRTLWLDPRTGDAEYGVGGGIVADSRAEEEFREMIAKAAILGRTPPPFALVETMAAEAGRILRLDRHLARLAASARYLDRPCPLQRIRDRLAAVAGTARGPGRLRIRLELAADGRFEVETAPLELTGDDGPRPLPEQPAAGSAADSAGELPGRPHVRLAAEPVPADDLLLYHKTTSRAIYDRARATASPGTFDVLLWNERGELTEFTRGNLVVELDGKRVTPPRSAGLLGGCLRGELLDEGRIEEGRLRIGDLDRATRVWFINSARGWIDVEVEGHPGMPAAARGAGREAREGAESAEGEDRSSAS